MNFGDAEAEALLDLLELSLGYRPTGRLPHITRAVAEYARELDTPVSVLIARGHPALLSRAIAAATVGHTLFFRHREHFERLREEFRRRRNEAPVNIWSAGCSTGEEPVSIALTAREVEVDVRIAATDIDEATLDRARRGNFANRPPDGVERSTVETILGEIDFRHAPLPWPDATDSWELFDIIFCRNVLIYFSPADATALLESVATRLAPRGLLVVSPVEALLPLPSNFRTAEPLGWLEPAHATAHGYTFRPISSRPPRLSSAAPDPMHSLSPQRLVDEDPLKSAAVYFGLGALAEAEQILRGLLDKEPSNPKAWFLLGEALCRRGELVQARLAFHAAARTGHENQADDAIIQAARRRARTPTETD